MSNRITNIKPVKLTGGCLLAVACLLVFDAFAAPKAKPLPQPLTLSIALKQANGNHPLLRKQRAMLDQARAKRKTIKADNDLSITINGKLRYAEPSELSPNQDTDDSQASIIARKRLYDFGRTRSRLKAADLGIKRSEILLLSARDQHKLAIMRAYFAVLLADLAYSRDNEAMASAYVRFDKLKQRNQLGQVSDVELLKSETAYHKSRTIRYGSDVARRIARSRLANLMNRPGELPAKLSPPTISFKKQKLPASDAIFKRALQKNRRLLALKAAVDAARKDIKAAKAGNRPVVEAEVGSYEYQRQFGSRDDARASINIRIPLFNGGRVKAQVAHYTAIYYQRLSDLRQWQLQLRQLSLELRQALYVLRAKRDETDKLTEYRELNLDKARALYELDVRKTLGDAMVKQSAARYEAAKVKYQLLLTWAKMNLLQGKRMLQQDKVPASPVKKPAGKTEPAKADAKKQG